MKKLSEKQGEKLPYDSVPSMMQWQSKGAASWKMVEDTNNGEPSFKIFIDVTTSSELYMSRVGSMLQHEFATRLSSKESRKD